MTTADRVLSNMRDKYRRALRQGVLDSQEAFDLLVLARELGAGVVTENRGITPRPTSSVSGTSVTGSFPPCWRSTCV
jgi:predicted DNA-binding protein (UPF0278 family)|nr:PIN domain-containing protein [Haloplanus sp. HW8-1]